MAGKHRAQDARTAAHETLGHTPVPQTASPLRNLSPVQMPNGVNKISGHMKAENRNDLHANFKPQGTPKPINAGAHAGSPKTEGRHNYAPEHGSATYGAKHAKPYDHNADIDRATDRTRGKYTGKHSAEGLANAAAAAKKPAKKAAKKAAKKK